MLLHCFPPPLLPPPPLPFSSSSQNLLLSGTYYLFIYFCCYLNTAPTIYIPIGKVSFLFCAPQIPDTYIGIRHIIGTQMNISWRKGRVNNCPCIWNITFSIVFLNGSAVMASLMPVTCGPSLQALASASEGPISVNTPQGDPEPDYSQSATKSLLP